MRLEWSIGPYDSSDASAINDAFNEVFGLGRSLREWSWKFQPEQDGCRIVIAKQPTGEVVAQYGAMLVNLQVYGREVRGAQPVDVLCRRSERSVAGRAFIKTVDKFFSLYGNESLPVFFGFPGDRALRLGQRALGYEEPCSIGCYRKRAKWKRFFYSPFKILEEWNPKEFGNLWERARHRYPVAVIRDQQRLDYRYRGHPEASYRILSAWRDSKCEGLAVLTQSEPASVVDVVWDGKDTRAITALDRHISKLCRSHKSPVTFWMNGDERLAKHLLSLSWKQISDDSLPKFVTRSYDPSVDADQILHDFYITMGDTDLV